MENKNNNNGYVGGEEEGYIDEDVLVSILSTLPLLDLVSACQVSKSWNRAVSFSLRRLRTLPWFFIYKQRSSPPYTLAATATAYDPNSDEWIQLKTAFPVEHEYVTQSSHSTLLYELSPERFSFSVDAFHLTWRHVAPPTLWMMDPLVAVVGRTLIVAGGMLKEFKDNGLAVELLDIESNGVWERCESMPDFMWGMASSSWLSVAASLEKMYVTDKSSGVACCFDPETRSWTELVDLCPLDCELFFRVIAFVDDRLIMAAITGDEENPTGIELWEVLSIESRMKLRFESIGSMPKACFDRIRVIVSDWPLWSITLNAVGDMIYIHDSDGGGEIVAAEIEGGKLCKWRTLGNVEATRHTSYGAERHFVACSNVNFSDLKRAFRENLSLCCVAT